MIRSQTPYLHFFLRVGDQALHPYKTDINPYSNDKNVSLPRTSNKECAIQVEVFWVVTARRNNPEELELSL